MNILDELVAKGVAGDVIVAVAKLIAEAELLQRQRDANKERMRAVRARVDTQVHTGAQERKKVRKKDPEAKASAAVAAGNPERADLYRRGKQILGPSAGGQITRLLDRMGGTVSRARAILENAAGAGNPGEYVAAVIRGKPPPIEQDHDRLVLEWCRKNGVSGCSAQEIPMILEDMNGGKPYQRQRSANGHDH